MKNKEVIKNDIKMVALDLDGTTFNSAGKLTDRTRKAIERACDAGVHVVVSTGRAYTSLPDQIKNVRGLRYAITSNGAHINDISTGEAVYSDYLSAKAVDEVVRLKEKFGCEIEIFIGGTAYIDQTYYDDIKQNGCAYRNAEYVLWSRRPAAGVTDMLISNKDRIENVNFVFRTLDLLEEARPEVMAIPEATITSSFPNNLEVGGPGTSKKAALTELMKRLSVDRENLMCCGDAPNDIQMLEFAGLGVAVGNAWGGTLDHADYVTDTNDNDGVAKAIERFVLHE